MIYDVTPADLVGLPDELIQQINISESDKDSWVILNAMNALGGTAHLDKILIQVWKDTGRIWDRTKFMAKLYRMHAINKIIRNVPTKKGVYEVLS